MCGGPLRIGDDGHDGVLRMHVSDDIPAQVRRELARRDQPARVSASARLVSCAMEQLFLGDLFPGIIGFGRVHCVRYPVR